MDTSETLFFVAAIPVVLLLYYIYKKDVEKEPTKLLRQLLILGAASSVPIIIIELAIDDLFPTYGLNNFFAMFITILLTVGLIEEFFKWVITYLVVYPNREYNHPYDGIVYAVFTSLGFALAENILYVVQNGITTGLQRAFTAIPSHAVDAIFMGYFLSKAKEAQYKNKDILCVFYLILSILIPVLTHTMYDSIIYYYNNIQDNIFIVLFYINLFITFMIGVLLVKKLSKVETNFDGRSVERK